MVPNVNARMDAATKRFTDGRYHPRPARIVDAQPLAVSQSVLMRALTLALLSLTACPPADAKKNATAFDGALKVRGAAETWRIGHRGDCPRAADLASDVDPWGLPYEVICGEGFIVRSNGADRKPGTPDDVYSEGDSPDDVAKRIVKALAYQAAHGKRHHTCPSTVDPWGQATIGLCDTTGATVTSSGPDGKPGTEDDISALVDAPPE